MTSFNKNILIVIASFFLGVLVCGAAVFYILSVNPAIIQKYLAAYYKRVWPPASTAIIDTRQASADLIDGKYNLVMPRSKVSFAYYQAFSSALNEITLLDSTNREEIYPLVVKVKEELDKENYDGLTLLSARIQNLNDTQKKRQVIATSYINNLATANEKVTDEKTKELTITFIAAGKKLNDAYIAYSALIDKTITQDISEQTADETKTALDNIAMSTNNFQNAAQNLVNFFEDVVKEEIKNATTS